MPESRTRVSLLGGFSVEVHGDVVPATAWRKRRPVELLVALALAPGHVLHREELIDRLWPDKDLDAGANNLHRALHDLRRIAGADLAVLDRGAARLAEAIWIDVDAFEAASTSGSKETLSETLHLYRGPLLPDDPYSDALAARREGLRQRFIDAALRLAHMQRDAGESDGCIETLRRLLGQDPSSETAHQLLIRTLAESGRVNDALRQFAECSAALRTHLDAAPAKATLDLRSAIERGEIGVRARAEPRSESRRPPPTDALRRLLGSQTSRTIYGRADELAAARQFGAQRSGVLLLAGEAGLGKTRLAGECIRAAAGGGAHVLLGIALDQDSGVPYAPFADAWAHLRRAEGASDPFVSFSPTGASAQEDRLRLFQAVEHAIDTLAGDGPVCLVIEDLHQADPSSLHLFHHLARATRTLPLLLVGTLRAEEVSIDRPIHRLLGNLGRERLGTRIVLDRMDRAATRGLVTELFTGSERTVGDEIVDAVHALTEGNPFHTEEVVRAMRDDASAQPTLPQTLRDAVVQRVRRLGRDADRLFSSAAVVGLRFSFEIAHTAASLPPEAALDALEHGIEARIVEEDGDAYRFRHALTRQALLDALTHARRVYLHRAIAAALEARTGSQPEVLAFHHEGAGQLERALPHLLAAGERAQKRLGFGESVAFYERALELMDAIGHSSDRDRFAVLRALGGMRMALSDLDGAVRDLDAAAMLVTDDFQPSAEERALVRRIAALALIQGGRLEEAGQRLDDAERVLRGSTNDPGLPAVLYLLAQLRWHQERYADARALAQRSLVEAEARSDRVAIAKAHEMLALACHSLGEWQAGHAHEIKRQEFADGAFDVDQTFDVHLCLWEYHLYGDQGEGGIRAAVDQLLDQARRMKAPRAIALCESFAGTLEFQLGQWASADERLRRAIDGFRLVGSASGEALSLHWRAVLLTARGELDEARQLLDDGIVVGQRAAMRSHCLTRLYASLARNRLAAGDPQAAEHSLQEGLAEAQRHGHCATCSSLLLPEAVRVALAVGNVRRAEKYARELADVAKRFDSRAWTAMAELARGRVLSARGATSDARGALERARKAFETAGCVYEAARCAIAESRVSGDAGLARIARQTLAELGASDVES